MLNYMNDTSNKIDISKEFNDYLNNLNFAKISHYKLKRNKNKYLFGIKDGIFNFKVNLKIFSCCLCKDHNQCSLKKCKHIYYILIKIFKLKPVELMFIGINNNIENVIENKEIKINEEDLECPICIENIFECNLPYYKKLQCLNCGKFYHSKCYRKLKDNKCVNCFNII